MTKQLFALDAETVDRIKHSAEAEGKGGWQNLCAEIMRGSVGADGWQFSYNAGIRAGLKMSIEQIENLRDAIEED
jgi:hypothetical protein